MRIVSASVMLLLAVGCGGSSSETPPPLEPDPTLGRYTGPRLPTAADDKPLPRSSEAEAEPLEAEQPRRPGRSTWGSGKAAPTPAPSLSALPEMTSPNALPPRPAN